MTEDTAAGRSLIEIKIFGISEISNVSEISLVSPSHENFTIS